jgi:hypothetical protein
MLLRKVHPDTHEPASLQLSKCLKRNRTSRILYGQVLVYGQLKKVTKCKKTCQNLASFKPTYHIILYNTSMYMLVNINSWNRQIRKKEIEASYIDLEK